LGKALHALGMFCARRSWTALGIWALMAAAVVALVVVYGPETSNDLELPGTESQQVQDLLTERFPPQQNGANPIVFHVEHGKLTDQDNKQAIKDTVKGLRAAPHVYSVTSPLSDAGQTAGLLSKDKQTAFAPVLLDVGSAELDAAIATSVFATTKPASSAGIQVEAAGSMGTELSDQPTESSEVVGILCAMLILTLVLGSLIAMGMPIITAVVGLAFALATIGLMGHLFAVPDTGATLATMIGLGVGIDYALFMVTRHQQYLEEGMPVDESIGKSVATSGSAIVFAGGTVVVALVALRVANIPLLSTLGLASAVAVLTAVLAAITFLPAVLGLLGHRIHWLSLPAFMRRTRPDGGVWGAWAGFVTRRPVLLTVVALAFLAPLIVPAPSLAFGQEDIGAAPTDTTERKAYDLITAGFGPGYNGPLQVASKLDPPASPSNEYNQKYAKAKSLQKQLQKDQKTLPQEKKQLQEQQAKLEAQQKDLEAQQSELERQQAELERQQAGLEQQRSQLEAQGAQLQREQASLEGQAQRLQTQKAKLLAEKHRLIAQRNRLERQARALAEQARPLIRRLAVLEARERVLERRIARAEANGNNDRANELRAERQRVLARQAQERAELAPIRRQAEQLANEARALQARADQLQRQADALQAQANGLPARADQLRAQANRLEQQKADLEAQGKQLTAQANQLRAQADRLQQQGAELQQAGVRLQKQANALKSQKQTAKQQQKEAEKLQRQLTKMVTAAGGDPRATDTRVTKLQHDLSATTGVQTLTPPQTNKKGDVVLLSAVPTTAPATDATAALLNDVRDHVVPRATSEGGITTYVGGYTASYADLATLISQRLLLVIGTVILLGFLLLMIAFRSLLIPLQAALTNVLSAAAAFGILTACFQFGWGIDLVGLDTSSSTVPIASYVPLMMFAVLFGLSMDYEVFLVSHIQQHHLAGEPARQAACSGLRTSARITTAACLIMTSVFASFILNGDPTIKQFGVGLSTAVLLAGLLVITLAPATIALMGEAAWWLPRWLNRVLPHIDVEGGGEGGTPVPPPVPPPPSMPPPPEAAPQPGRPVVAPPSPLGVKPRGVG
jgi:uncharacterized membrane protein YdfJ with MMPL/SSD domain